MNPIKLIVGLGNPGSQYRDTRHNAGFWWVDQLAAETGARFNRDAKFGAEVARVNKSGCDVWLLKPLSYMNESGQSVGAAARFYRLEAEEILVVHDELDLPNGAARMKKGGGHGGHNGLKDLIAHLGSSDFWRLRLGIDHPGDRDQVVDYVLHQPSCDEMDEIEMAMRRALKLWPQIVKGDHSAAMKELHSQIKSGSTKPVQEKS